MRIDGAPQHHGHQWRKLVEEHAEKTKQAPVASEPQPAEAPEAIEGEQKQKFERAHGVVRLMLEGHFKPGVQERHMEKFGHLLPEQPAGEDVEAPVEDVDGDDQQLDVAPVDGEEPTAVEGEELAGAEDDGLALVDGEELADVSGGETPTVTDAPSLIDLGAPAASEQSVTETLIDAIEQNIADAQQAAEEATIPTLYEGLIEEANEEPPTAVDLIV